MTKEAIWNIGRIGPKDKSAATLEGTVSYPADHPAEEKPILRTTFSIKGFGASGLKVDKLSFKGIKYKPFKGVRHITKSGTFEIRS